MYLEPVEHLRWSFFAKIVALYFIREKFIRETSHLIYEMQHKAVTYFRKKAPSQMLDWVLHTTLNKTLIVNDA